MGPVYTDPDRLRGEVGSPIVAVGDVVTRHLTDAGARPDLAVVDWVTERESLPAADRPEIEGYDARIDVTNPAAALTGDLLAALRAGVEHDGTTVIVVDGEEDLAAVPALVAAPAGASVVYGQPGEGMVHVTVDDVASERARDLLRRMDGEHDRVWSALGVEPGG
ncbi:GTP-dependent dephospho-CoA kinase family protein [Halococcus agarilyticus]|uniref:GTP-dependent dephospho-CoA kinase family protein n=1 Tax=Halococcus agarilyticus TaxID=1232219 RepID=UPI0009AE807F|nr:GTP-dependent dephospho-CoA kinase family protein [Halococcus agarilyticus]